ncbi:MAG: glycoside hydrolase family 3 C-terminal domain-containing protein [Siculibacillus sp.]|nr:glycoside hydrolase family 3 C-terminal domain-containing protein [Siculibacillus sp.]
MVVKSVRFALVLALAAGAVSEARADAIDRKIDALMRKLTLEDKIGQVTLASIAEVFHYDKVTSGAYGNVMNFGTAPEFAKVLDAWKKSRLKIPLLHGTDIIYGNRTLFVPPIGQAASFDLALNRAASEQSALESVAAGTNWTYAPMVDLSRDPRWGRVVEGAGEDVHLASCLAGARVEGLRAGGLVATAKHFVAYGFGEGGRDYDAVEMGEPFLRDRVLPPFRAAIAAGAETVMSSFNAFNGVPATANGHLLKDILRRDMRFGGIVTSDWGAIDQLKNHGLSPDPLDLTVATFNAGVDLDMASDFFRKYLPTAIAQGRVSKARLDEAVRRVLRVKFEADLGKRMTLDPAQARATQAKLDPRGREIAIEMGRRTTLLLHNPKDRLPLSGAKRIAVVGGLADSPRDHMGPHPALSKPEDIVTLRAAIMARAEKAGASVDFLEACGACRFPAATDDAAIAETAKKAADTDVIIAVVGETYEESGEAAARADLALSGPQTRLIDALAATGKPVVVLLSGGRPMLVESFIEKVDAIAMVWFPGSHGAIGVAEVLFGDASPSARLPFTWPRSTGQLPLSYDRLPTGRPASADDKWTNKYIDIAWMPRFPFGYGLSYGRTTLSAPRLDRTTATAADTVKVTVTVANAGPRAVRETVQVYVHDVIASRSRPSRELKGWAQVDLAPGESRDVTVPIRIATLGFHVEDGGHVVEPGRFRIFTGKDATTEEAAEFEVTKGSKVAPWEAPIPCVEPGAKPAKRK